MLLSCINLDFFSRDINNMLYFYFLFFRNCELVFYLFLFFSPIAQASRYGFVGEEHLSAAFDEKPQHEKKMEKNQKKNCFYALTQSLFFPSFHFPRYQIQKKIHDYTYVHLTYYETQ